MGRQQRFLFVTHARSNSNLLMRMINSQQDGVKHSAYNFGFDAVLLVRIFNETDINSLSSAEQTEYRNRYNVMAQNLRDHFDSAEVEKKIGTCKEHAVFMTRPEVLYQYNRDTVAFLANPESSSKDLQRDATERPRNVTTLDDGFLKSVTPIFLIRHPALIIPSYARVAYSFDFVHDATLKFTRAMYDWYRAEMPELGEPLIINATDCLSNPGLLHHLATKMGLDPEKIAYSWPAATKEEMANWPELRVKMTQTLAASTGIIKDRVRTEIDIDTEVAKWQEEFGEEKSRTIKRLVEREMDDYSYFMDRRLTMEK